MISNILHIKNMVCGRCIKVVREELGKLGYQIQSIDLGTVKFEGSHNIDFEKVSSALHKEGFELIDDESTQIINRIKTLIIKQIHTQSEGKNDKILSEYLEKELNKGYTSISSLFSTVEGRTIEKYVIQQRIERVKELLVYGEKTISEIAWQLGYSSAQYLSNQFKSETGLTPSQFRNMMGNSRKPLDEV